MCSSDLTLKAVGYSHRHTVVETMDQASAQAPLMLAELEGGQLVALGLCDTDARHGPRLVGEMLERVLGRADGDLGAEDPILYTRKLAAGAATRIKLVDPKDRP